jgi:broad specificity phosphatase PhoE
VRRRFGTVQRAAQGLVHFAGEAVEGLRAVERDNSHGTALLVEHGGGGRIGHGDLLGSEFTINRPIGWLMFSLAFAAMNKTV